MFLPFDAHLERFTRLRPLRKQDPYNPEQTVPVRGKFDELQFNGCLAQSSSTVINDQVREQTNTSVVLTVFDHAVDVQVGDRVRRDATGVVYRVTGDPARDMNVFTGWQPTAQIMLTEIRG